MNKPKLKGKRRPNCCRCGERIWSDYYPNMDGKPAHEECAKRAEHATTRLVTQPQTPRSEDNIAEIKRRKRIRDRNRFFDLGVMATELPDSHSAKGAERE